MEEKQSPTRAGCGRTSSRTAAPKVPPLPKLHSRGPLVTTQLSKPIFKSTVGHDFDLSRPIEDQPFIREYNPLHDPHTRAFFHRPTACRKLQRNGFVTSDMQVVSSLREYNAYREFMEIESMKMRKKQEETTEKKKQALEKAEEKDKVVSGIDKEREERRGKFFKDQERKLASRQRQMRREQQREQQERLKAAEEKKLMRERNEIRREAEREQRWLAKLQHEHQEALEKRQQLHSSENQMLVRMLQLQHTRQSQRLQQIREVESKWQAYDDHVQRAREEEEMEKTRVKEEKERKRLRRKKIVELIKAKKEARLREQHEQTCHQAEELKKQADEHEKLWREKKEEEVMVWRERIHREQEHWEHHMQSQLETCHTQHQREMDDLLHHSYLPKCAKTGGPKWAGSSSDAPPSPHCQSVVSATAGPTGQRKSRDGLKQRKKSVRFQENASVHIIEEDELGLESDTPPMGAPGEGNPPTISDADNEDEAGGDGSESGDAAREPGVKSASGGDAANEPSHQPTVESTVDGDQERDVAEKGEEEEGEDI